MTKEEIYAKYTKWINCRKAINIDELFHCSMKSYTVYENEKILIDHLYFMEIKYVNGRALPFVFYEANTFYKLDNGDLQLVFTTYKCVE